MNRLAKGLLIPNGIRNRRKPAEDMNADSTTMAAILVYCEPNLAPSALAILHLKKSNLATMANVMLKFNANDSQKYSGVKLTELVSHGEDAGDDI